MEVGILNDACELLPLGEQGEICTRGPAVFAGYWNNPDANAQAFKGGWFHTGDLGVMDARGFVPITGRSSDMHTSGGSNVYPREVEEAILSMPNLLEAAVFSVPDADWGERGVAVVVARDAASAINAEQLLAHLDGRLAKYKWPRHIVFWPVLPKSAYGKLVKKDIRAVYLQATAQSDA